MDAIMESREFSFSTCDEQFTDEFKQLIGLDTLIVAYKTARDSLMATEAKEKASLNIVASATDENSNGEVLKAKEVIADERPKEGATKVFDVALAANKTGKTPVSKKRNPAVKKVASTMTFATPDINSDEIGVTSTKIGTFDVRGVEDTSGEVLKAKEVITTERPKEGETKVFDVVEQMPEFGEEYTVTDIDPVTNTARTKTLRGQVACMKWIGDHIKYPTIAEENGIQGRVVCTFVVERDGSVTDVQVARSIDPSLDKEAVRVLSEMPNWKPGRHKGENVRVKYTVPVTFKLQ